MAENTKIEWCHDTLNLWWGCTKVSDGCKYCYAETLTNRYGHSNWGPKGIRREVKSWRSNLSKMSKLALESGERRRVFCQSMSDTFEGPETMGGADSENWATCSRLRLELMCAIHDHPELDFLLLTKRPENAAIYLNQRPEGGVTVPEVCPNLWIGTSCEDQATADERIPHLLRCPAAVRFLSCEPLLGPLNLRRINIPEPLSPHFIDVDPILEIDALSGATFSKLGLERKFKHGGVHWVIGGGESGPHARPMDPSWARSLRDQCVAAGVPFHFKQWGEYAPFPIYDEHGQYINRERRAANAVTGAQWGNGREVSERVGKHAAGRVLDGRTWDEFPEVARG